MLHTGAVTLGLSLNSGRSHIVCHGSETFKTCYFIVYIEPLTFVEVFGDGMESRNVTLWLTKKPQLSIPSRSSFRIIILYSHTICNRVNIHKEDTVGGHTVLIRSCALYKLDIMRAKHCCK